MSVNSSDICGEMRKNKTNRQVRDLSLPVATHLNSKDIHSTTPDKYPLKHKWQTKNILMEKNQTPSSSLALSCSFLNPEKC